MIYNVYMKLEKHITDNRLNLQDESGNALAYIDYELKDDVLYINKVFVSGILRGQGIAGLLMKDFVEFANGRKMVPICSYAESWLSKNNY